MMASRPVHRSDVQRLFLQAILSRRIVTEEVARAIWKACNKAILKVEPEKKLNFEDTLDNWNTFLNKLDDLLSPLGLSFDIYRDEETGVRYRILKNEVNDECAQLATDYAPTEIAFFKALVEQIMLSRNHAFSITSMAALREVSSLKGKSANFTRVYAENILRSFVARGWLRRSTRGRYSLGPRTLNELENYIKSTYEGDYVTCVTCEDILTKGVKCPTPNCQACLHFHCFEEYKLSERRQKKEILCPKCRQPQGWSNDQLLPVGEGAIKDGQLEKRRVRDVEEDDDDEEDEQNTSQYPSQSQIQTQTQGTQRRARKSTRESKKSRKRNETPESEVEDEIDDMYEDDVLDIDNLAAIRERP